MLIENSVEVAADPDRVFGGSAKAMVGELADRVRAAIDATTAAEPTAVPGQRAAADSIKAGGIVWTVLAGMLRGRPTT